MSGVLQPYAIREVPLLYNRGFFKTELQNIQRAIGGAEGETGIYNALAYVSGGGSADDSAGLNKLINSTIPQAGGLLIMPPGTYAGDSTLNITRQDITIWAMPGAIFKHRGSGVAVQVDGSDPLARGAASRVNIDGLTVNGNVNTTYAWRFLLSTRSTFRNLAALNCTLRGFSVEFCVTSVFDTLMCSRNLSTMTSIPAIGLKVDAALGSNTTNCYFIAPIMEGLTGGIGIDIQGSDANHFLGGTSEANATGVNVGTNAGGNSFKKLFCEANTVRDFVCDGFFNKLEECYMRSALTNGTQFALNGYANTLEGGFYNDILIDAGNFSTVLNDIKYSGAITDNSTFNRTQKRDVWKVPAATFDSDRMLGPLIIGGGTDTAEKLQVAGATKTNQIIGGGSAPTFTAQTGAGTGPTITVDPISTDVDGKITVVPGVAPAASAVVVSLNFAVAYGGAKVPRIILQPASLAAAALSGAAQVYISGADNTHANIAVGATPLVAATTYVWNYVIAA